MMTSTHHVLAVLKIKISAGEDLEQHVHEYDHDSWLPYGIVTLTANGVSEVHEGPKMLKIPAGVKHNLFANSDCEWWCMHEIDEKGNVVL
jgi:quercetin dioxygenase-like cupin family protein